MSNNVMTDEVVTERLQQETVSTTTADKAYQLAEYSRLVSEIEMRVGLVPQFFDRVLVTAEKCIATAGVFLTLAGLVIGVGPRFISAQNVSLLLALLCSVAAIALWCCVVLLAFLAGFVGENDLRVAQINYHIRYEHEKTALPKGWETIRHGLFEAKPWFSRKKRVYHELAPRRGTKLLSMRGLFLTVQVLSMVAGAACALFAYTQFGMLPSAFSVVLSSVLFLFLMVTAVFTVITYFTIEHRRHRDVGNENEGGVSNGR
jgi:hypothetical protein